MFVFYHLIQQYSKGLLCYTKLPTNKAASRWRYLKKITQNSPNILDLSLSFFYFQKLFGGVLFRAGIQHSSLIIGLWSVSILKKDLKLKKRRYKPTCKSWKNTWFCSRKTFSIQGAINWPGKDVILPNEHDEKNNPVPPLWNVTLWSPAAPILHHTLLVKAEWNPRWSLCRLFNPSF